MSIVYSDKITPRLTYTFIQIFNLILELLVAFTLIIEKFASHSGPKLNFTNQPRGNNFFVKSRRLLFQQGIYETEFENKNSKGLSAFFKTGFESQFPYDIFAASFYLTNRYWGSLPYYNDEIGSYASNQSLTYNNSWRDKFLNYLRYRAK